MAATVEAPSTTQDDLSKGEFTHPDPSKAPAAPEGWRKVSLPPEAILLRKASTLLSKRAHTKDNVQALDEVLGALQLIARNDSKRGPSRYDQPNPIEKELR